MSFTQVTSTNLNTDITVKLAAGEAAAAAVANIVSMAVQTIQIADSSYNVLDDTAANTGGGYLVITGTGFTSDCIVIIGATNATSTTYVNSTTLRAQVPAASAATYTVYVVDTVSGATAIKVNGLTYSAFPAWSTGSSLSNQVANTSFGVSLSASGDSSITYANTTTLPAGTTLAANGYFSGTVSIGSQTTYSFDVKATDVENQDVSKTFSLTVTVTPPTRLYSSGLPRNLGIGDTTYRSVPTQVGALTDWQSIFGIGGPIFATKTNGTLFSWGQNDSGQLGLNDAAIYRSSPVQVGTLTNWSVVSPGTGFTVAYKTDGTLWTWGSDYAGCLGLNTSGVKRSSPTQIGSSADWAGIGSNGGQNAGYNVLATKTNGTLWAWGRGNNGQLGLNISDIAFRSSPTQVGALTDWLSSPGKLSMGAGHNLAIKSDGTLWAWGAAYNGQLGTNNIIYRSSPVQIGSGTTWMSVCGGWYSSFAIKSDGTLWAWGRNTNGQLGLNDRVYRSSPVQVGVGTSWSTINSGMVGHTTAGKSDGTLWSWGGNPFGNLGINDKVYRSSPVQVGSNTNWLTTANKIAVGYTLNAIQSN